MDPRQLSRIQPVASQVWRKRSVLVVLGAPKVPPEETQPGVGFLSTGADVFPQAHGPIIVTPK